MLTKQTILSGLVYLNVDVSKIFPFIIPLLASEQDNISYIAAGHLTSLL